MLKVINKSIHESVEMFKHRTIFRVCSYRILKKAKMPRTFSRSYVSCSRETANKLNKSVTLLFSLFAGIGEIVTQNVRL